MKSPRIAILCPGVGLVQRGFERLFRDIFDELSPHADITLFKGGGPSSEREKRLTFLPRGGKALRYAPVHKLVGRTAMHAECMTFALASMPHLVAGRYDLVHVIDPPLARVLYKMRDLAKSRFRLLYTEGTAMPPGDYPPADHIHQISAATFEDAVSHGIAPGHMTTLPCGVRTERIASDRSRAELRKQHGIPDDRMLVLSIAALNRNHKRTDYLIDEFAKVPDGPILWIDGSLDHGDPDLPEIARRKLGDRVRITHVRSESVGELYRMADLFVHTAGFEAFGLSIVEAAISGLPILTHDDPHFRWLIPNLACQIDMKRAGALSDTIASLAANPAGLPELKATQYAHDTYDWAKLKADYLSLYRKVAAEG